jgi:uncharacterized protein YecE (DUF72 family)
MADLGRLLIGCSGWSYGDNYQKGGWVGSFYPDTKTKKLPYYARHFKTVEFDAIYYQRFYEKMGPKTFEGMVNATPADFEFSVKVPEIITREKKLNIGKGAFSDFEQFLARIELLRREEKLGAILFQMSPNFTVDDYANLEQFCKLLPKGYQFAIEFRHGSSRTEGPLELLKQHNLACVMTDSPETELNYLSNTVVTADHAFVRLHGRGKHVWYRYLYEKHELRPWADKASELLGQVKTLRMYYNNHPMGNSVLNTLDFKEIMHGLTAEELRAKQRAEQVLRNDKQRIDRYR